jgi:hypothetical protein
MHQISNYDKECPHASGCFLKRQAETMLHTCFHEEQPLEVEKAFEQGEES